MDNYLLNIKDLTITSTNPKRTLIENLSLQLKENRNLALVGESGSGKTTITKAILGFLPENCLIKTGSILFEDIDITKLSPKELHKIRGQKIATILQNAMGSLTPSMRIGMQIIETLRQHHKMNKEEAYNKAMQLLTDVCIPNPKYSFSQYPFELSGGMRQRVVIAIALASQPKLILADEPTTALDSMSQAQVLRILRNIQQQKQATILLVTHNLSLVKELCNDICIIKDGKLIETGTVEEIFLSPKHPYTLKLLNAVSKIPIKKTSSPILKNKFQPLMSMQGGL
ncbi:oligopeptide transport ATP-binding protein [Chlamydia pneumoniae TW-183]|uniref:Nickel import system ATP-binding protein NikD n=2 Tax=Chlamydia pneumoniae TaxID=83558 RepID=A0A0F7XSR7_CHLPN|nr:ABC transporter ATP-binding protein [Chlamydia pneumoniae]AAD18354.1 Oligopeptide Transport ATPase [Chlamydia pneumoniae CWL029]AAP98137.1 oligopeptide transport ATP-binding protein [Chlamydia pneumoniae TW-183]ACZ33176.1 oligopeptide ABC transporter, ATP-binding protein OppD [Chlamydia pneumoniae LPCoLN]ETR80083.1 Oligopeptide transport ATP-binding protein OppD [Chlamydia pneumoniae B21]CRI32700.1 Oligopeptide transport ATP-binding protein OppD [Chlamydia pneumoniae]